MPKFHNPTDIPQRFEIGARTYHVPAGANVEIPEQFAYIVPLRSMKLREGESPKEKAPSATVVETLPSEMEQLLTSPRVTAEMAADFRAEWRRASARRRGEMAREIERVAGGFGAPRASASASADDADDAATDGGEADVDAQLDDAVKVIGKGRRRSDG